MCFLVLISLFSRIFLLVRSSGNHIPWVVNSSLDLTVGHGFFCGFFFFPDGPESPVFKSSGTRDKKCHMDYVGHPCGDSQESAAATYIHAVISWTNACTVLVLSPKLKSADLGDIIQLVCNYSS